MADTEVELQARADVAASASRLTAGMVMAPDDDGTVVEVLVDGEPLTAPPDCTHTTLTFQPLVGIVKDDDDNVVGWQLRVRARCALCGVPFDVDRHSARRPQDHPLGIVFDLYPLDHDPGDLPVDMTERTDT